MPFGGERAQEGRPQHDAADHFAQHGRLMKPREQLPKYERASEHDRKLQRERDELIGCHAGPSV